MRSRCLVALFGLLLGSCDLRSVSKDDVVGLPNPDLGQADTARRVYTQVASGWKTVCALLVGGELRCWGKAIIGVRPERLAHVSVGMVHACGIDEGAVVRCWGDNQGLIMMGPRRQALDIVAGYDMTTAIIDGVIEIKRKGRPPWPYNPPGSRNFRVLAANNPVACAINEEGEAHCWGPNFFPWLIPKLRFARMGMTQHNVCGLLRDDRQLICWTAGMRGTKTSHLFHKKSGWRWVDGYGNYLCAIDREGTIHCDGTGDPNGFGDPPLSVTKPPVGQGYVQVSTGHYQACALHQDGHIDCWGENDHGQLNVPAR